MYVKRQEQFDAIQFTGGEESAKQVIEFVREKDGLFGKYQKVTDVHGTKEQLLLGSKEVGEGSWVVFGYTWNDLDLFTDSEFERIFQPADKGHTAESVTVNNYFASDNAALKFTENGLEETDAKSILRDAEELERVQREAVIANGVIDTVPGMDRTSGMTVAVKDGKIEKVEYFDEMTLDKVRKAIDTLTTRQPYAKTALIHDGVSTEDVITVLQNAGILFRERA